MNPRPSTSMFTISHSPGGRQSARSLRWRILSLAGGGALLVLGIVGYAGLLVLQKSIAGDEDARIVSSASLSQQLVQRLLAERARQVQLIASEPTVIAAVKKGTEVSRAKGLENHSIADLEQMFKVARSQQVDDNALRYLNALLPKLDIAEVMLTDEFGYNAVTTSLSSDFVQSDEAWWQAAWGNGLTTAQATIDPVIGRTVVELAGVVRDGNTRVGVVKVKFGLSLVDSVLAQGSGAARAFAWTSWTRPARSSPAPAAPRASGTCRASRPSPRKTRGRSSTSRPTPSGNEVRCSRRTPAAGASWRT